MPDIAPPDATQGVKTENEAALAEATARKEDCERKKQQRERNARFETTFRAALKAMVATSAGDALPPIDLALLERSQRCALDKFLLAMAKGTAGPELEAAVGSRRWINTMIRDMVAKKEVGAQVGKRDKTKGEAAYDKTPCISISHVFAVRLASEGQLTAAAQASPNLSGADCAAAATALKELVSRDDAAGGHQERRRRGLRWPTRLC